MLAKTKLKAQRDAVREFFKPHAGPRLGRDIAKLLEMKRPLSFFIAEGDPGREIVMTHAKRAATRGVKSGENPLRDDSRRRPHVLAAEAAPRDDRPDVRAPAPPHRGARAPPRIPAAR